MEVEEILLFLNKKPHLNFIWKSFGPVPMPLITREGDNSIWFCFGISTAATLGSLLNVLQSHNCKDHGEPRHRYMVLACVERFLEGLEGNRDYRVSSVSSFLYVQISQCQPASRQSWLDKAKPISNGGILSGITYSIREGKNLRHLSQQQQVERGARLYQRQKQQRQVTAISIPMFLLFYILFLSSQGMEYYNGFGGHLESSQGQTTRVR